MELWHEDQVPNTARWLARVGAYGRNCDRDAAFSYTIMTWLSIPGEACPQGEAVGRGRPPLVVFFPPMFTPACHSPFGLARLNGMAASPASV